MTDSKSAAKPAGGQQMVFQRPWSPFLLKGFVMGDVTLGELEGLNAQGLFELAQIAHFYLTQNKLDEARTLFQGLHVLDPFDSYYLTAQGVIEQRVGVLDLADSFYTKALEVNPFDVIALANRGDIRIQREKIDEGLADLRKAMELDPQKREPSAARTQALLQAFDSLK